MDWREAPTRDGGGGRRFKLVELVGSGGFSDVFLADMQEPGEPTRRVALKVLRDSREDTDAAKRLRDEARILTRLDHPNIVVVHDLLRLGTRTAMVMDFVPGIDLGQLLASDVGAVPINVACRIGADVADALDTALHAVDRGGKPLRVLHRDIKPSNIRITPTGEVRLLDFGVAHASVEDREAHTGSALLGSFGYMPPERIAGEAMVPAGDVYGLGKVVLELCLGERLGRSSVVPKRHDAQVDEAINRLRSLLGDSEAAADLVATLRACLAHDPAERPSARHLRHVWVRASRVMPGPPVAEYAEVTVVAVASSLEVRPLDEVLAETDTGTLERAPARVRRTDGTWIVPVVLGLGAAGLGLLVAVLLAAVWWYAVLQG